MRRLDNSRGITLIEVMVATLILSGMTLSFILAMGATSKAIQKAKTVSLAATPLTLEKLEVLKKLSYHRLLVTTATLTATEFSSPNDFTYDSGSYPSETIRIGDLDFLRRVLVRKVSLVSGSFVDILHTDPDTGVKRITVYTIWQEDRIWKKFSASTLYANPKLVLLNSTVKGNVDDSLGNNLKDVQIIPLQAASYSGLTTTSGDYSFVLPAGDYTLRASKFGYYTAYSGTRVVPAGSLVTTNFDGTDAPALVQIASGTVTGNVWISTNILISGVIASSGTQGGIEVEGLELYNPTTWTWTLNGAAPLELRYDEKDGGAAIKTISLIFNTASIATSGFYLIASTSPVCVSGSCQTPDAVYDKDDTDVPADRDVILDSTDGGVGIRRAGGAYIDRFAWSNSLVGTDPPDELTEGGSHKVQPGGLGDGQAFYRYTSTGAIALDTLGPAYDTNISSVNFGYTPIILSPYPRNSGYGTRVPITGTPAHQAVVSANDGLSSSTQAVSFDVGTNKELARFTLPNVATGTWRVEITTGTYYLSLSTVTLTTSGQVVNVPSATTVPSWPVAGYHHARTTATITAGFLSGQIIKTNASALAGITVRASGVTALSDSGGRYTLSLATGTHTVEANPASASGYNSNYISVSSAGWPVEIGKFTTGVDFSLSEGGVIQGRIMVNATDPLPYFPVISTQASVERGSASSGADGYFLIKNLSTGTYSVIPQIDLGESSNPLDTLTTIATAGSTVWSATFTISGALGKFTGTVKKGTASIKTGVLIIATTTTITSATPPTNNDALRDLGTIYYVSSSKPDGTYEIEVRGGAGTYNIYGWYTTYVGEAPTSVKVSETGTVAAGANTTKNLLW